MFCHGLPTLQTQNLTKIISKNILFYLLNSFYQFNLKQLHIISSILANPVLVVKKGQNKTEWWDVHCVYSEQTFNTRQVWCGVSSSAPFCHYFHCVVLAGLVGWMKTKWQVEWVLNWKIGRRDDIKGLERV